MKYVFLTLLFCISVRADAFWYSGFFDRLPQSAYGGVFEQSPEEKALSDFREKVARKQILTGMNRESAIASVRLDEERAALLKENIFLIEKAKADGNVMQIVIAKSLADASAKFMELVLRTMKEEGGSIGVYKVQEIGWSIDKQAAIFLHEALSTKDADGNPVRLTAESIDNIQEDIENWAVNSKKFLENSSTTKRLTDLNRERAEKEKLRLHELKMN